MSTPLILSLGTACVALGAGLLRSRRELATSVAVGGAAVLALFVLVVPIDEALSVGGVSMRFDSTWTVLGRSLIIDGGNRTAVGLLYLIGAFMIGGTWTVAGEHYLQSVGLMMMNVVAASLAVRPFVYAAIFVELAAMGGAIILVAGRFGAAKGALRLLAMYTLGMMVLLWAGWLLGTGEITSGAPEQAQRATIYLALGFAILLGIPPFHLWLPTAGEEANPMALTFVALILQSAGLFFLLQLLNQYTWLRENVSLFNGIRIAGAVMVVFGGAMAIAQQRMEKMMAYVVLTDFGIVMLAVGSGTAAGFQLAIGHSWTRAVSLSLWGLGAAILIKGEGGDSVKKLEGAFWRYPYPAAAALVGLFSAGGFPLTAGFPGRWALIAILAPTKGILAGVVLLGTAAIALGGLRWLTAMVRSREASKLDLRLTERVFMLGGVALCAVLGLFPQLTYPLVVQAASGLANLVP